jgi:hypothetical protein
MLVLRVGELSMAVLLVVSSSGAHRERRGGMPGGSRGKGHSEREERKGETERARERERGRGKG